MAESADKPYKWFVDKPDGTKVIMRRAYDPRYFTFPARELEHFEHIRSNSGTYGGSEDVLDEYDFVSTPREAGVIARATAGDAGTPAPLPRARTLDTEERVYTVPIRRCSQNGGMAAPSPA
jgi:hypothetical protein